MLRRLRNLAIALDQLAWVILTLGHGSPDETISAALYRMESQDKLAGKLFRPFVDLLFRPFEREHCKLAYHAEHSKSQLPESYR